VSDTGTRERILLAAARLLAESGGEPVSTRAVCAAAGVGAPTLYHHFGDKSGLFDAVVMYGFDQYLIEKKALALTDDPVEDLRRGWNTHVEFGLANPAFYTLMYGSGRKADGEDEGYKILLGMLEKVARAGRLRVPVKVAVRMILAAGTGVTLSMITTGDNDQDVSTRTREAVLAAITTDKSGDDSSSMSALAIALTSAMDGRTPGTLSEAETAMLREWLTRVAVE
jgi:AcrR family transcriptional regulator